MTVWTHFPHVVNFPIALALHRKAFNFGIEALFSVFCEIFAPVWCPKRKAVEYTNLHRSIIRHLLKLIFSVFCEMVLFGRFSSLDHPPPPSHSFHVLMNRLGCLNRERLLLRSCSIPLHNDHIHPIPRISHRWRNHSTCRTHLHLHKFSDCPTISEPCELTIDHSIFDDDFPSYARFDSCLDGSCLLLLPPFSIRRFPSLNLFLSILLSRFHRPLRFYWLDYNDQIFNPHNTCVDTWQLVCFRIQDGWIFFLSQETTSSGSSQWCPHESRHE